MDGAEVLAEIKKLHKLNNRRPVKRDSNSLYQATRKFYGTWNNALRVAGYYVKDFQNPNIPKISPELAYFVGLIITDGHLRYDKKSRSYSISIYNSYPKETKTIIKLIKQLFNYSPTIRKRKYGFSKSINNEIIISSKKLVLFLHQTFGIPLGAKSKIIQLPVIFAKDDELFYNFLRGVIDGDGHIRRKGISISSQSETFLKQIKNKLADLSFIRIENARTTNSLLIERQNDMRQLYAKLYGSPNFFYNRKKDAYDNVLKSFLNK